MTSQGPTDILGGFFAYFVRHRTAANLLLLVLIISGVAAGSQIRAQFFPDIVYESVTVSVAWPGASAEEIDKTVVARFEARLREVDGVDEVTAVSRSGSASLYMAFAPDWNMSVAQDDVTFAVDDVTDLPGDVETPVISLGKFRDRVTDIVVSGPVAIELLDQYADELRKRLFAEGISKTSIQGISEPVIQIEVDDEALARQQLTLSEIVDAVRGETGDWAIGEIDSGAARIRAESGRADARSLSDISVRSDANGSRLRLGDVASVKELGLDNGSQLLKDGHPAILMRVERDASGDTLDIHRAVKRVITEMVPGLPAGVDIQLFRTRAKSISARLQILLDNGFLGLIIVMILLFLFLSPRTAFWVAAGIPVAMAGTVALMYLSGLTINMVSLFAMIICLGIIVDDAIVVGEHADRLYRSGMSPTQAAIGAATRMGPPVLAASITTVIAFGSLIFIGGRFGSLIIDLSLTVCVLILMSLIECFIILPAHMRHSLSHRGGGWLDKPSAIVNRGFDWFRDRVFRRIVEWTLRLRYPIVAGAIAMLAISVSMLIDNTVRWQFFSAPERGTITANISMLPEASRDDTRAMLDEMNRALSAVSDRYQDEHTENLAPVDMHLAKLGGSMGRGLSRSASRDKDLLGAFSVELLDPDLRPWTAFEFIDDWKSEIKRHPLLDDLILRGERSGPGGDAVHVQLTGDDARTLKAAAESLETSLSSFELVGGVQDDLAYDKAESIVTVTPRGESLGFDTARVASLLRAQLQGTVATRIVRGTRNIDVEVMLSESDTGAGYLRRARLPLPDGGFIALTDVASIRTTQGFASLRRENGAQVVNVTGDLADDPAANDKVIMALERELLPEVTERFGVTATLRGLAEQERDFLSDAFLGFLLCIIGIYLTLAWIFASWTRPLVIILVIPFGFIGALWGHHWHQVPLSMFSVVGLIGLSGIIINDSIVLMTTIDERARTHAMFGAIIDGSLSRLRAVLLTTITTVGGLGPLLILEQSRQAQFLKPTVITLVYGLGFGVIIVLLLTPSIAAIGHDIRRCMKSFFRSLQLMARLPRSV